MDSRDSRGSFREHATTFVQGSYELCQHLADTGTLHTGHRGLC